MGVLFLFQLLGTLLAQETASHSDTLYVINSISKKPLSDVKIISKTGKVFSTNDDGYFIINNVMGEHLPLIIEKKNYHSTILKINHHKIIVELKPIIFLGDEVKITEEAFQSEFSLPIKTYQLNSSQIENSTSAQSLIESLPSITLKSYGGRAGVSTVSVHGGQSQRFSVMFDGVPINNEQNGGADISQIPTFLLSNLEYLSQGHSSRFGSSAMTGILNLSPSKQGSKISFSSGNFDERAFGVLASKSFKNSNFTSGFGQSNYNANFSYKELGDYSQVPYQLNSVFDGLKNAIQQEFLYSYFQKNTKNSEFTMTYFDVKNSRNLSTHVYSSPIITQHMKDELQTISTSIDIYSSNISLQRKKASIEYLNDSHSLITDNITYSHIGKNFTSTISMLNVYNKSSRLPDTSKTYYTTSTHYKKFWKNIVLATSFKIENEENTKSIYSYDLILKYNNSKFLNSSFTFSQNYKKPNFNDLFWEPFGNPNLDTEFSKNYYLKAQYLFTYGELNINSHFIAFDNLISWRPMVGTNAYWIPENISSANSYGIDLSYQSVQIKNTTISTSYSLSITEIYNRSLSNYHHGKSLLYSPIHSASLQIQTLIRQSAFTISTKFVGDRIYRYNWPEDNMLPNYFTTNLGYRYGFTKTQKFERYIHLKSENIFDTQYQSVFGFPVPGRSYTLTITIKERK